MQKIRLYIEQLLSENTILTLNHKQSHYIYNVMRLKYYDNIFLFNGKDGEWSGEIIKQSNKLAQVKLKKCVKEQQHEKDLYLYCAVVKTAALNNIIRQSTEMGVTHIQFILTQHTIVRNVNLNRIKLQAIEAAEQCERINIPEILAPINFSDLAQLQNYNFILCDPTGISPENILETNAIIIGPEGGFSQDELNFASSFCQKISLGKQILRVDTAAVVALALLNTYTTK
ncbi:16S rRNA (uracil(1498)-N(3))-methyltransferase [Wolbachia pipientis]|uniref:Ribosomal RNA small subunit methyltransferase E n=1 Tax=Wolbachia pipientis TaxID=955 RepID=A0A1E7QKL1_WOLPI|nr:16S rRNA (uracil(1498)-N(3))-methyltransferase [Wolbachia pipientis]OEY87012.1 16S rRNA (uracil(1498)-N(3))-methyltransferase [Wolbachia pipientis]